MKRGKNQLPLPLKYNDGKENNRVGSDDNSDDNSRNETSVKPYKEGVCYCTCAGCDIGYHCRKKGRGCGM